MRLNAGDVVVVQAEPGGRHVGALKHRHVRLPPQQHATSLLPRRRAIVSFTSLESSCDVVQDLKDAECGAPSASAARVAIWRATYSASRPTPCTIAEDTA